MCQPFSCVVKSDLSVLVGQAVTTHSHSEILRQPMLTQEISIDQYAKVELAVDGNHPADPDKWKLVLDEGRKPSWWEGNLPEIVDRVRQSAWAWLARIKAAEEFQIEPGHILYLPFGSPTVTMTGGVLLAYDQSAPVVTLTGGWLWTHGSSAPVVEMSGGVLLAHGQSVPVANGVKMRPGQRATIVNGDLVISCF